MIPLLVGVSGYARSGKDTFASVLVDQFGFRQRSFAAPLRRMLYAQNPLVGPSVGALNDPRIQRVVDRYGWEAAKDRFPEVRRLLQALGTEAGRQILGENVWVDAAMIEVDQSKLACELSRYVFADVRFRNEAEAIADRGGIIVRIERDGFGPLNGHESETAMDDWSYDYVIHNNGTVAELHQQAVDVVRKEEGTFTYDDWLGQLRPPDEYLPRERTEVP